MWTQIAVSHLFQLEFKGFMQCVVLLTFLAQVAPLAQPNANPPVPHRLSRLAPAALLAAPLTLLTVHY